MEGGVEVPGDDDTIEINDIPGFPAKIKEITAASAALRSTVAELAKVPELAKQEASKFTRNGEVAPIYSELVSALSGWSTRMSEVITAACTSSDNCSGSAAQKFVKEYGADLEAAAAIKNL